MTVLYKTSIVEAWVQNNCEIKRKRTSKSTCTIILNYLSVSRGKRFYLNKTSLE